VCPSVSGTSRKNEESDRGSLRGVLPPSAKGSPGDRAGGTLVGVKPVRIWRLTFGLGALVCGVLFLWLLPAARLITSGTATADALHDHIVYWSWIASAFSFAILVCLGWLSPWWAGRSVQSSAGEGTGGRNAVWFWPAVAGALLILMTMTLSRLGYSLWDDEETSVRFAVVGRYERTPPAGDIRFREVSWAGTLFYYQQPNNHVFHNILARFSNSLWRTVAAPTGLPFREEALRLPAFLAGAAGLLSLAWLLKSAGFTAAGAIAAWILALHPWYQRYACEARGYSLVLALLPVALVVWQRGLLTGKWRWWSLLAAVQFLLVWTYPAVVFVLAPLAVATPLLAWKAPSAARPAGASLGRWFCCQALAAAVAVPVMAPLVPQAREYFQPLQESAVGVRWLIDYLGYLGAGLPWRPEVETAGAFHPRLEEYFSGAPLGWTVAGGLAIAFIMGGALVFFRRSDSVWRVALACGLAGPLLQLAYAVWARLTIWEWYLLHALPWVVAFAAVGLAGLAGMVGRSPAGRPAAVALVVAVLAGYAWLTEPVRRWQGSRPVTPTREAVLATRPDLDPHDPANKFIMTAGLTNPPAVYDANVFFVQDPAELVLLCRMADISGRPLWLNIGHLWALQTDHPDTYRLVRDRRFFDRHQLLLGHTAWGDRMVGRYIPGSLDPAAVAEYLVPEDELFIRRNLGLSPEEYFGSKF